MTADRDPTPHIVAAKNIAPRVDSSLARSDWALVEIYAREMVALYSRTAGMAAANWHAEELIRRAEAERAARQAQLAALANAEIDE